MVRLTDRPDMTLDVYRGRKQHNKKTTTIRKGSKTEEKRVYCQRICSLRIWGMSGGEMVLGKLPVLGRPTIRITVGQGPTALAVGAGGVVWTFLLSSILSLSLWETARYRLKYCLKGPFNQNNQPTLRICPLREQLLL